MHKLRGALRCGGLALFAHQTPAALDRSRGDALDALQFQPRDKGLLAPSPPSPADRAATAVATIAHGVTVQRGPFNAFWMRGIGAEDKDETAYGTHGAAYVYRTSDGGATYSQLDKLAGSDDNGSFGASVAIDGSTVLVGESRGEDPDGVVFDGSRARSGVVHVFSSDASLWSSGALGSTGSSSGGSSGGSDSNTGAIVAGCVFVAFALLFVGAVAYFYRLSPEEQAAAKEKFWAAEAEGEKQVKALFAKAEGEPETAAKEAAP